MAATLIFFMLGCLAALDRLTWQPAIPDRGGAA
jgi:hypothetical protein